MLKVTVEIWPFGDKAKRRELGTMLIVNDCTGTAEVGNYWTRMFEPGKFEEWFEKRQKLHTIGHVKDHIRVKGFWPLVMKAIKGWV